MEALERAGTEMASAGKGRRWKGQALERAGAGKGRRWKGRVLKRAGAGNGGCRDILTDSSYSVQVV